MVNGPMTRAQLGAVVAANFARFIEVNSLLLFSVLEHILTAYLTDDPK